jgi:1,2-diacylglycerol 3-alpha-glucosyltransferase
MEGSLRKIKRTKLSNIIYWTIYYLLAPIGIFICKYIFGVKVINKGVLAAIDAKKVILISNHCMYNDPLFILYAIFPNKTFFTTLQRNIDLPIVGKFIQTMGAIALPNNKYPADIATYLSDNKFIHFFPEGNLLHYNQQLQKFHKGAFYFAYKYQIPIVCISNKVYKRKIFGKTVSWLPRRVVSIISKPQYPPTNKITYSKVTLDKWILEIRDNMQRSIL